MRRRSVESREELLRRFERVTEWPQVVLAIALIPILLAPHVLSLSANTEHILVQLDYLIWGVFAADLVISLAIAPRRVHYLRTHWVDVLLVALPMLRPFRTVRALRALRAFTALDRVLVGVRRMLVRRGLHYILITSLLIVVCSGLAITVFERDESDPTIRSVPDGLWWAVTTVTTVGYGDTYPKTEIGRGLGIALMLVGVGLFGVITANLAAYFVEEQEDEVLAEIRSLRIEVRRLTELLDVPHEFP